MDMDLEQKAIMRLREAADTSERFYKAPLIVTTSGGKDSSVCVALAEKAGIDFEVMHNHTTVDAPETVYFIRHEFKRLEEKKEMWSAVKDRNEDAFAALSQEFERSSRILAEEWAQTSALAKIAVISESND